MLSWRTKLGGNLKIIEDMRPSPVNDDEIPAVALKRRRDDPPMGEPTRSGSERHWKAGMEEIVGHWNDDTAIFSLSGGSV